MINNVKLEITAGCKNQFPNNNLPQIAFVGKSNVGKSSLINTMVYRKSLAHTSNSPGKTRTINFYNLESNLYFVDLPGYGYARASKTEIAKWSQLIENYLSSSKNLRLVLFLIDIRHAPGKNDKMMYDWLKFYNVNTVIVATKADKIKNSAIDKHIQDIRESLGADEFILPFSSEKKFNRDALWKLINEKVR